LTVAVVIPTIAGREAHLRRCLEAHRDTAPDATLIVERDHRSCGAAWIAGAARAPSFDYVHFTADDLEPHPGWFEVALETVQAGHIPAPLVYHPDGELESAGLWGFGCYNGPRADWQLVEGTTVPFLTREMWEAIGMIDVHYCSDLWVSTIGRRHGWETAIRTGMRFTHHTAQEGRDYGRAGPDTQEYMRRVREEVACAS
jgi:hypothetical protein